VEVTLLRCIKYGATRFLMAGLLLAVFVCPSFAAVKEVQTYVDSTWSNEIYYMASLSGYYGKTVGYDDIKIKITAIDEYTLYINGAEVGSDNNWETVEEYTVPLGGKNIINVGVKVINHGKGFGNGLIMDIEAGQDQLGTWTKMRDSVEIKSELQSIPCAWWTADLATKNKIGWGNDWYNFDETRFADTNITAQLRRAMEGKIIGKVDKNFSPEVEIITGYLASDVDIGYTEGGGISIRRIEGENLALNKPCYDIKLTDGDLSKGVEYIARPLGDTKYVDLGRIYRVNKMTLFSGGEKPSEYMTKSIRGYSVEISLDEFSWAEVGVIHDIGKINADKGGYDNYSVEFPPEWARYARYHIVETRVDMPKIGEMMVFGLGCVFNGSYESPWYDFGQPTTFKNFDMITWDGVVPDGTKITIQTKTKIGDGTSSEWSSPNSLKKFSFDSPEPATQFQYKVNLLTDDIFKSPVFKRLEISYSETDQPVSYADGFITPNRVAMGADSTFVYTLSYSLNPGQDLKTLVFSIPSPTKLNYIYSTDLADTLSVKEDYTDSLTIDSLYITFKNPITDTKSGDADTLYVSFDTRLMKGSHSFEAFLYNSTMNDNAGGIRVWENKQLGTNTVVASSLMKSILTSVEAIPKVLTPYPIDNKNDFTVIEFTLAKVSTEVMIKVFNTAGTLVATIFDKKLEPRVYSIEKIPGNINAARELPGYWDGKNDDGDLVPPGIYIYQIIAQTDEGDEIKGGTVVVAY
jgi:hypothetical protein